MLKHGIVKKSSAIVLTAVYLGISHLYLQWCQNHFSLQLALKFAFEWHTEKFILGTFCLAILYLVLASFLGSYRIGLVLYTLLVLTIGIITNQKMSYRNEPFYPDDLQMITQWRVFKDLIPASLFWLGVSVAIMGSLLVIGQFVLSLKQSKRALVKRLLVFSGSFLTLLSLTNFNQEGNWMRKLYNQTALWIPYSQEMNYYNVGFVGGFLYNLRVPVMEQPEGYSQEKIAEIVDRYTKLAADQSTTTERPNIVYIMSESFSDPDRLTGIDVTGDPLKAYHDLARTTRSGQMLSQGYGGGTANIEFEALTGFSMGLLAPQMTTPYTMLVPKLRTLPSVVSFLADQGYETTAIHPYNTSMYKRQEVYHLMGFDQFYDQTDVEAPIRQEQNPYISDESAYESVLTQLTSSTTPQFVHLVTMQTHMPYGTKYTTHPYTMEGFQSATSADYLEDIHLSSEALAAFIARLKTLDQRTLVVFWGDHLPGIYDEAVQAQNTTEQLHLTEFLMYDTKQATPTTEHEILSPYYFAPELLVDKGLPISGFYALLHQMATFLPAAEKNQYYQQGTWQATQTLDAAQQQVLTDYTLITYDILAGAQYSQGEFFKPVEK